MCTQDTEDSLFVDFGRTASDYAQHRPGFPDAFFDKVAALGIGLAGQHVLDLGTGTGTLARGFARRGCVALGLDPSPAMLSEANKMAEAEGVVIGTVAARAEDTGQPSAAFDVVSAGQCWHWFDRARAASEAFRLLRSGGHLNIAYFSYLPDAGSAAEATEELVLKHNPTWPMAGLDGRYPEFLDDLTGAGFRHVETFDFVLPSRFSHEAWRGRFRACNGVLMLPTEARARFDEDLAHLLAMRFPEPIVSAHRIFGIVAVKP
jgi:SAM-dependent methyltransferase